MSTSIAMIELRSARSCCTQESISQVEPLDRHGPARATCGLKKAKTRSKQAETSPHGEPSKMEPPSRSRGPSARKVRSR